MSKQSDKVAKYQTNYEKLLIHYNVISNDYTSLTRGESVRSRFFRIKCNMFYNMFYVLRFVAILVLRDPKQRLLLGDVTTILGPGGKTIIFVSATCAFICSIYRPIVHKLEKRLNCDWLTDLAPLALEDRQAMAATHLNYENLIKMRKSVKFAFQMSIACSQGMNWSFLLIFTGLFIKMLIKDNYAIYEIVLLTTGWIIESSAAFYYTGANIGLANSWFLSINYLKLRYNQINETVEQLATRKIEFSNREFLKVINEHNDVTSKVHRYHPFTKWVGFVVCFLCTILSSSVAFNVMYVNYDAPFVNEAMFVLGFDLFAMVWFFTHVGAMVYSEARKCNSGMHSILACNRVPLRLRNKAAVMLEAIGSEWSPIAIYAHELYPMTPRTFIDCVLTAGSFFMLAVGVISDEL